VCLLTDQIIRLVPSAATCSVAALGVVNRPSLTTLAEACRATKKKS